MLQSCSNLWLQSRSRSWAREARMSVPGTVPHTTHMHTRTLPRTQQEEGCGHFGPALVPALGPLLRGAVTQGLASALPSAGLFPLPLSPLSQPPLLFRLLLSGFLSDTVFPSALPCLICIHRNLGFVPQAPESALGFLAPQGPQACREHPTRSSSPCSKVGPSRAI